MTQRPGEWIWTAGGAAIVDHAGKVRQIAILGANVLDDVESIERTVQVLISVNRKMELFQPCDFAHDAAELLTSIDGAITRWRERPPKVTGYFRQRRRHARRSRRPGDRNR